MFTYGDDIVLMGSTLQLVQKMIGKLATEFAIKELGDLSFFLGYVFRSENGSRLSQQQYFTNLLTSCKMTNMKPSITPMLPQNDFPTNDNEVPNVREYYRVIGSL